MENKCSNIFGQAVAFWHMGKQTCGGCHPIALQKRGIVGPCENLDGAERLDSLTRGGGGIAAIFTGEGWYQIETKSAKAIRSTNNTATLQVRAWLSDPNGCGTLFYSDSLALGVDQNGLAICFLGEKIPSGVVFREMPLTFLERECWLDLVLRIKNGELEFFCNGSLQISLPVEGELHPSCYSPLCIGAFGWGTYHNVENRTPGSSNFFIGKIDHVTFWDYALSDRQVAVLSGLNDLSSPKENDATSQVIIAYNRFFYDSVDKDIEACYQQEQIIRKFMDKDPYRPTYHLTAPIGWILDPAGAYYYKGQYHVFSYRNIYSLLRYCSLDHYVSDDLIHWRQWPIGPWADCDLDVCGIWLNNHFIDDQGIPNIIYSAHGQNGQMSTERGIRALSNDDLLSYGDKKAIIMDHHDGHTWKEEDVWYTITTRQYSGKRPNDDGDSIVLLSSYDLENWTEHGEIFTLKKNQNSTNYFVQNGFMEFPYLLTFGDKDVLMVGGFPVRYWVGRLDRKSFKFIPDHPNGLMFDYANSFHCFNPMIVDQKGPGGTTRRVVLAMEAGAKGVFSGFPWNGVHAMPRSLELDGDHLRQDPLPEIEMLRGEHYSQSNILVTPNCSEYIQKRGDTLEIIAEFEPGDARVFGLKVCLSDDRNTCVRIFYDTDRSEYGIDGNCSKTFYLVQFTVPELGRGPTYIPKGKPVKMRVFLDKCLVETFVNGQTCTSVLKDPDLSHNGLDLFSEGGKVLCKSLDIWEMKSANMGIL